MWKTDQVAIPYKTSPFPPNSNMFQPEKKVLISCFHNKSKAPSSGSPW